MAIAVLLLPAPTWAADRVALLVTNNLGLPSDASLRHTQADAIRLATVLVELGGFAAEDVRLMHGATAEEVLAALQELSEPTQRPSLFLFYYSGHAYSGSLHLGGTTLPIDLLTERLSAPKADLTIAMLDACHSGAVTRPKGVRAGPAFDVRVNEDKAQGQVMISSSAADERSFESDHHGGALFTVHWVSGLRGAADRNGDAQVTLSEAYEYAYAQTVRGSFLSAAGPQHPTFKWDFSARRDPVLSFLNRGAGLTLRPDGPGTYALFDAAETNLIFEVYLPNNAERRLALAPGEYAIKKRGTKDFRTARVRLVEGDDRILYDHDMQKVPWARLAAKGPLGNLYSTVTLGQMHFALGANANLLGAVGMESEGAYWLWGIQGLFSSGVESHKGLETRFLVAGAAGSALYPLRMGRVVARGGPLLGLAYLHQATSTREPNHSAALLAGVRLRLDLEITRSLSIVALGDLAGVPLRTDRPPEGAAISLGNLSILGWASYGFGVRVGW